MTWTSERLPIVLPPQPGEALDSWITAYARRLHTTGPELLKHMGINQVLSTLVSQPPTTDLDVIAQRAGVPSELVHSMTLDPHISPARFPFLPSNAWTPTAPWRPLRDGSRYCPDCLEEHGGRWPLAWRLPWTFSCREHECLLIDSCPKCQGRPRASASRASDVHRPGRCTRRIHVGRTMPSCGHPLALAATTALPRDGAVLEAQQHVTTLLEQLPEHESAPLGSQLHDIYVLGWRSLRALSVGGPTPDIVQAVLSECGLGPDGLSLCALPSTDKLAVGTTLGTLSTNSQTGAEILTWIVRADHGSPRPTSESVAQHQLAAVRKGARGRGQRTAPSAQTELPLRDTAAGQT